MIFELVLILAGAPIHCQAVPIGDTVTSTVIEPRMAYWSQNPFHTLYTIKCNAHEPGKVVAVGEYPSFMACMQKVAAIGAGDNVNAICREKK